MKTTGSFVSYTKSTNGIEIEFKNAKAIVYVMTRQTIRCRVSFTSDLAERNYAIQQTNWDDETDSLFKERAKLSPIAFSVEEHDKTLLVKTDQLQLEISKEYWALKLFDQTKNAVYSDAQDRALFVDNNQRINHYFNRNDSDYWYGLGEKTGPLEKTGRRFRMESTDAVGYSPASADPLYKHIPFLIRAQSNNTFVGLYYNNAWPSEFDIGCTRSGYWGEFGSARFDGGDFDLTFFVADNLPDIVQRYTAYTGKPPLMPRYSLGYLGSTMYYTELTDASDEAVLGFIDKCGREKIPVSGFHLSSGYTTGTDGKRYAFHWNAERFPNPQQFVQRFNELNLYLSPNIKPGILTTHSEFNALTDENAFIQNEAQTEPHLEQFWGGQAAYVDFTRESGRSAWKARLKGALIDKGITSIWNDNNEFEFSDTSALADGDGKTETVNALRPIFSNLMAKVAFDAVKESHPNTRPFILSRGGFAGLQNWAHTWSGDNGSSWDYLQSNITTMLGMSLSGVPFNGMDIGGFTGPAPEPELFLRWIQNGIFHPRFCIHSANEDNTVTEPWMHASVKPFVINAMQTRYKLLPYLYQQAYFAHRDCKPITAPLVYHFWQDDKCRKENHDFMLGDALFIPAIIAPGVEKKLQYFPKNERFINLVTGERIVGGRSYEITTPLGQLTWFLRASQWLVMSDSSEETQLRFITTLEKSEYEFYWDDGISYDFEKDQYSRVNFSLKQSDTAMNLTWELEGKRPLAEGRVNFQFYSEHGCPMSITLNDSELKQWLYEDEWQTASSGFWFDSDQRCLHIRINEASLQSSGLMAMNFTNRIAVSI